MSTDSGLRGPLTYLALLFHHAFRGIINRQENARKCITVPAEQIRRWTDIYIRSRFLGALLMMLSTRRSNSAASDADETTALLSL